MMTNDHRALPVGRTLRLLLGIFVLASVWPFFRHASGGRIFQAVFVALALAALYGLLHWLVSTYLPRLNRWLGAVLAILPLFLVYLLGGGLGQVGALSFLGVSLLLAAIRADGGCEVMSLPALAFGKRTHLVCLLFSPLDCVEEKIVDAVRPSTGET